MLVITERRLVIKICCVPDTRTGSSADPERTQQQQQQRKRTSLASLLFFTVLLSDRVWLCAEGRMRGKDRTHAHQHRRGLGHGGNTNAHVSAGVREEDCGVLMGNLTEPAAERERGEREEEQREQEEHKQVQECGQQQQQQGESGQEHGQQEREQEWEQGEQEQERGEWEQKQEWEQEQGEQGEQRWKLKGQWKQEKGKREWGERKRGRREWSWQELEHAKEKAEELPLESVCSALYTTRREWVGPAPYSPPGPAPYSRNTLLDYFGSFSLAFCDALTLADLLEGVTRPEGLDCSLAHLARDLFTGGPQPGDTCSACVSAYARLDQHAHEKYLEFHTVVRALLDQGYSVRADAHLCEVVYKAWLCVQYFPLAPRECVRWVSCKQYCREVMAKCPFILPDNDHLVYAGMSSFICTDEETNQGPDCCDVRWSGCDSAVGVACALTRLPLSLSRQRRSSSSSDAASCACRLYGNKLKLCVLALFLLHTVISIATLHPATTVSLDTMVTLEEGPSRDE